VGREKETARLWLLLVENSEGVGIVGGWKKVLDPNEAEEKRTDGETTTKMINPTNWWCSKNCKKGDNNDRQAQMLP